MQKNCFSPVSPSNFIINHVAVKFTVIWFPMNKFTQPALHYCMNEMTVQFQKL